MSILRRTPTLTLALLAAAVATTAGLAAAASPVAAAPAVLCIPLLQTCPPPTMATTTTTKAPTTTVAPTASTARVAHATTTTTRAAATRKTPSAVGAGNLAVPAAGPNDLSGLGTAADPAAPQLAGTASPVTTVTAPLVLPALVGTSARDLPDDHATARIALSILVLLIAVVAAAQLPAKRRTPRPSVEALD